MLVLALAFLFETWVWDELVAAFGWIGRRIPWQRMRRAARDVVNRLPAIVAVLLFGVPFVVMEGGCTVAVALVALGHVVTGATLYGFLKVFGVSLVAVIYDLTQEKLMTLPWFVWLHAKFQWLHELAQAFVAPYKQAALDYVVWLREHVRGSRRHGGHDFSAARNDAQRPKSGAFAPGRELD